MKQHELRIGNWVDWDEKTIRSQVKGIHPSGNYLHLENGWVQLSRCEPIPLTEEWLVRFGFISDPYYDRYEKGSFRIDCNKTRGFLELYECTNDIELKYVHQLQNLYFALTGEKLELK